jgi:hypothetical protein
MKFSSLNFFNLIRHWIFVSRLDDSLLSTFFEADGDAKSTEKMRSETPWLRSKRRVRLPACGDKIRWLRDKKRQKVREKLPEYKGGEK